jgi:RNA polymerase sigma-70 factor (ECF subfamily)
VLVALFYEEERSLAEIAQIMNLTLSNVKVRLHRLRGRLRHYMEE